MEGSHFSGPATACGWTSTPGGSTCSCPPKKSTGAVPKLDAQGGYPSPESQSPWQDIFREKVQSFERGATLEGATKHIDIAAKHALRNNH